MIVVAILFVVYFWNLDQKVLGCAYQQVNLMFDRKTAIDWALEQRNPLDVMKWHEPQ